MSRVYKRLVIVDPQLKDQLGHNFRYAIGIAHELNLPTVALAHNSYEKNNNDSVEVVSCLSFDQYNNSAFKESFRPSRLDKLWGQRHEITKYITENNGVWDTDSPATFTLKLLLKFGFAILSLIILVKQVYTGVFKKNISAHRDLAADELLNAFQKIKLREGDLLVFQTMMWASFESLLELKLENRDWSADALFIAHDDWFKYSTMYVRFAPKLFEKRVLSSMPFKRSKMVVTNSNLASLCQAELGYAPEVFREIPLPASNCENSKALADKENISILVPGVFREDKNFELLEELLPGIIDSNPTVNVTMHNSVVARTRLSTAYATAINSYTDIKDPDDWLQFMSTFDIVLIPYGKHYTNRISGIIHEAKLLGIPVICSDAIADSVLIKDRKALLSLSKNETSAKTEVAAALKHCLQDGIIKSFWSKTESVPISDCLGKEYGWITSLEKPVAVQVKSSWFRCGTSTVLDAQLSYLVNRGYFVVEVYIKSEPWMNRADQIDFNYHVMRDGRQFVGGMAVRILMKSVTFNNIASYYYQLLRGKLPAHYQKENLHNSWCILDKKLEKFLSSKGVELVLVNHIFNMDFARKILPSSPIICETHDIQTNQLMYRHPEMRGNYDSELEYELTLLTEKTSAVVNLNPIEHKVISSSVGQDQSFYIPTGIPEKSAGKKYSSLTTLLRNEGNLIYPDQEIPAGFDLLIVGDGHPANIESIQWFLDVVFPTLPNGTTLGIIGKVCNHLTSGIDDVFLIGFLSELANVYEYAKVVVLPDISGEGIAIKTLEGIASGRPVSCTERSMRGFSGDELASSNLPICKTAQELSDDISKLIQDDEYRSDRRNQAAHLGKFRSQKQYFRSWDKVLQGLEK